MKIDKAHDIELIAAARGGDDKARSAIIERFQDVAVGLAYAWVGDVDVAREVAQEAFLDMHLHLDQLNDATAFPAWFRQIVTKHCDRVTRRRQIESYRLQNTGDDSGPEPIATIEQEHEQVRLAVAALSPEQRQVVALQYFAELTGNEVAEFLQIPLSTVKKRLRLARKTLREEADRLMKQTIDLTRPSNTTQFSEDIRFFIALRACDEEAIVAMLAQRPDLANSLQEWDPDLAYQHVLPFPSRATALITAVELDSMNIARALLHAGADPNGTCGCATEEPPLWAAALLNRVDHTRLLLSCGADPNILSASGNTPLHVAAIRGHAEIARLLIEAGADPHAKDSGKVAAMQLVARSRTDSVQRTAADWARQNGHLSLAAELDRAPVPQTDRQSCATRFVDVPNGRLLETGIKAVDFFAPIPAGGLVRLQFGAGVGMLVLLGELMTRFSRMPSAAVVWTGFTQPPFGIREFRAEMDEFGITEHIEAHLADFNDSPEARRAACDAGLARIESLARDGQDVLAIVVSTEGFENDIDASLPRLRAAPGPGVVTTILMTPFRREAAPETLVSPFDAQISFDRRRATKRLFPSLDPRRSFANLLFNEGHTALRQQVVEILAEYERVDPDFDDLQETTSELAQRLLFYFSQPFAVAEPFGGRAGEYVTFEALQQELTGLL